MYGLQKRRSSRLVCLVRPSEVDPLLSLKTTFCNPKISSSLPLPPNLNRLPLVGILSPPASPPKNGFIRGISSHAISVVLPPIPVFVLEPSRFPLCCSLTPSLESSPAKQVQEKKIGSPCGYNPCGSSKAMEALLSVISKVSPASQTQNSSLSFQLQHTPNKEIPRNTESIMSTQFESLESCDKSMHTTKVPDINSETQQITLTENLEDSKIMQPLQPKVRLEFLEFAGFPIFFSLENLKIQIFFLTFLFISRIQTHIPILFSHVSHVNQYLTGALSCAQDLIILKLHVFLPYFC